MEMALEFGQIGTIASHIDSEEGLSWADQVDFYHVTSLTSPNHSLGLGG